jgi:hypothetical protein
MSSARGRAGAVGDPAEGEPADNAHSEHQRQHLPAARGAVAKIGAVGNDVHLRHRHRNAASHARQHQQQLQPVAATRERAAAGRAHMRRMPASLARKPTPQRQEQRQHLAEAEDGDAEISVPPSHPLGETAGSPVANGASEVAAA